MSALLVLLNSIKTQHSREWLTPAQMAAVALIEGQLQIPGVVNLAGPAGCGKTFCGWILAHSLNARISVDPQHLPESEEKASALIIDNVPDDVRAWRALLTELQLRGIRRAVLITHHTNELGQPTARLPAPTAADYAHIMARISRHQPFYPGPMGDNLWTWIRSAVD
ncbi:MAG: hypothetical protein M3Z04_11270 [Chloroflexota bacterium]|nr:hypothetical protein [Chloroflexota bacterium]